MYLQRYKKYICFLDMMNYNMGLYKHVHRLDHLLSFWFIYKPKNTYPRLHWDMVICHRIFSIFSIFLDFLAGPFWVLVPFGWSLLAGPLWVGSFWLPTLKKCIFSQITLKFLILSASAHTGFDHQSAKIPAKTCSMFPGHAHRTVLQNQKEYCNFKNF